MKTITIHQPSYLPWLGYFHKIIDADVFIILAHVQFEKNGFINRNKILPPDGQPFWLTIPVLTKGKSTQSINEVRINNSENWQKKHFRSIENAYSKTPYWKEFESDLEILYKLPYLTLSSCLAVMFNYFRSILGLSSVWKLSSLYSPPLKEAGSDLILEICQRENADVYFSGISGKKYLDEQKFTENGVKIIYQDFQHPEYPQHQLKKSLKFVPNMSILDLLFNCGSKESLRLIKGK